MFNLKTIAFTFFVSLAAMSPLHAAEMAQTNATGVQYMAGGIGEMSQSEFAEQSKNYNLRLTFAAKTSGAYLADVKVVVTKVGEKSALLEVQVPGPFLFVNLAAGQYKVAATYEGETLTSTLKLKAKQPRSQVLYFAKE
ncbi:hypothetical protein NT239_09310 [Chitinibacter sp. SCUT-21]|uniref:hypothetical protein n=1 Tax=Chitinibacter sp. SCUT-21 TaxID=2970891 RepID=UPI0035A6046F